jgi:hypothetical protein
VLVCFFCMILWSMCCLVLVGIYQCFVLGQVDCLARVESSVPKLGYHLNVTVAITLKILLF